MAYIGRPPEYGGYEKQDITADGSTTTFVLNYSVGSEYSLFVSVAGIPQQPGTAYTLSGGGANIVFSVAPASTATVFIIFLGYAFDSGALLATGTITGQSSLGTQPSAADAFLIYDDDTAALKKVTYSNLIPTTHGDVAGPVSATDDALAKYDGTTGKLIQNSNAILSDAGTLTATAFSGPLTGNVTGNVSGTAATVTGATQASITSVGTLTSFASTGIDDNADALAITIDSAEKVGINQATPTARLHVKTDGASSTPFRLERSGGSGDEFAINMQGDNRMLMQMYQTGTEKIRFDVGSPSFISDKLNIGSNATATTTLMVSGDVKTTGQAYFADTTLTFDATQDWDVSTNQVCTLTLTANTTFDAPTNMVDGAFYSILMIQDGTGSRTASWNTVFKWAAATAPTLTTTASAKDIFVFRSDGTNMYEVGRQLNVS